MHDSVLIVPQYRPVTGRSSGGRRLGARGGLGRVSNVREQITAKRFVGHRKVGKASLSRM